jgi:hemolysin III
MDQKNALKPLLRGHLHQAAFFTALGACLMLIDKASQNPQTSQHPQLLTGTAIYAFSLITLFGVSALYHRPQWSPELRMRMRRLDHASIFVLIAGTFTPVCLIGIQGSVAAKLLIRVWAAATVGIFQSLFWVRAPKWFSALLCLAVGWLVFPYLPDVRAALPSASVDLLVAGGLIYTLGAVVYIIKKPDPWPHVFGYHEIFHLIVVIAATLHFIVINRLLG